MSKRNLNRKFRFILSGMILATLMVLKFPLQGSTSADFISDTVHHADLRPCPDSPNCVVLSKRYSVDPNQLFVAASKTLNDLNPHSLTIMTEKKQIKAVFRIPLFGFKDDVHLLVSANEHNSASLHIRSASRVGYSDLGVNRRRVGKILNRIQQTLNIHI
ncbi:DUF1499 domain-containing protein [Rhodohalobacter halophilus]|uniref:DUF1499 domain-containing protein n=1 Tax=Rhodohalobacter halophilus TaxID=1812810 RepID=UPI00114C89B4|nr:DUF1499 domain-containing protein [Rhodohalobacter halophilus]